MTDTDFNFLGGVDRDSVLAALARAGGDEIKSGKLASPESSAALAVNCFGAFLRRPGELPPFPGLAKIDWPALKVEVERQMRFPWRGGRHPWLDAAVETRHHLIGIESKRFEPFRDKKSVALSRAYDRDVWGSDMRGFCQMRDGLRSGSETFKHLDAAQLVKHAFGLVTEGRRCGKRPILLYLFAEPDHRGSVTISQAAHERHQEELVRFSQVVRQSEVRFAFCSYRDWLASWTGPAADHGKAISVTFQP